MAISSPTRLPRPASLAGATLLALGCVVGTPADAALIVYDITSTAVVNCGSGSSAAPHGLWTNGNSYGGTCGQYFDITDGELRIAEDLVTPGNTTGVLEGTAENPHGYVAEFLFNLSGWQETFTPYHQEGGPDYDPVTDTPDIDFFTIISGTTRIFNPSNVLVATFTTDTPVTPGNPAYAFQYGTGGIGANSKDAAQGASVWLNMVGDNGHWDFNLNTRQVPEPSLLALLGVGLAGLGLATRRRRVG